MKNIKTRVFKTHPLNPDSDEFTVEISFNLNGQKGFVCKVLSLAEVNAIFNPEELDQKPSQNIDMGIDC